MLARRSFSLLLGALLAAPALAQETYPSRPLRLIIPFAPGGGADAAARLVAGAFDKALGQRVLVESRPGGNTAIAAVAVAKAPPDGYTLLLTGGTTMSVQPLVNDKLPYEPLTDFAPVGMVSTSPFVVAVSSELGVNSLDELWRLARAKPGQLAYASNGIGGPVHLHMELLAQRAQVKLNHVPYKGFAPALPDLAAGRAALTLIDPGTAAPLVRSGQIRQLAITTPQRSPLLPELPTVAELGFPGFTMESWFAIYAPARTPAPVVARLGEVLREALRQPEMQQAFLRLGQAAAPSTAEAVRERITSELQTFAPLVKAANIRAE